MCLNYYLYDENYSSHCPCKGSLLIYNKARGYVVLNTVESKI